MTKPVDDGGAAFPYDGGKHFVHAGMSLRDYFAIHASVQITDDASPQWVHERFGIAPPSKPQNDDNGSQWAEFWHRAEAAARYGFADAMLAARARQTGGG